MENCVWVWEGEEVVTVKPLFVNQSDGQAAALITSDKKRPAREKFAGEALPLVAVNLEQFAAAA